MRLKIKNLLVICFSLLFVLTSLMLPVRAVENCDLIVADRGKEIKNEHHTRIKKWEDVLTKRLKSEEVLAVLKNYREMIDRASDCSVGNNPNVIIQDIVAAEEAYNNFNLLNPLEEVEVIFEVGEGEFKETPDKRIIKLIEKGSTMSKYGVSLPTIIPPKGKEMIGWYDNEGTLFGKSGLIDLLSLPILDNITFKAAYATSFIDVHLSGDEGVFISNPTFQIPKLTNWKEALQTILTKADLKPNYKINTVLLEGYPAEDDYIIEDNINVHISTTKNNALYPINTAPTIIAKDITIESESNFDPLNNVFAIDNEDGKIELSLDNIIENNVNTKKPGIYKVVYIVKDSGGAVVNKSIVVTVLNNNKKRQLSAKDEKTKKSLIKNKHTKSIEPRKPSQADNNSVDKKTKKPVDTSNFDSIYTLTLILSLMITVKLKFWKK